MGFFFAPFFFPLWFPLHTSCMLSGCLQVESPFILIFCLFTYQKKKYIVTFWGLPGLAGCFLWCFLVCSVFVVLLCCT